MIALFSLMVVVPNDASFERNTKESIISEHIKKCSTGSEHSNSQLSAALRAGAGPSLSIVTKIGPVVTVPAGRL